MYFISQLFIFLLFLISLARTTQVDNPICQHHRLADEAYVVKGAFLRSEDLFLIVLDIEHRHHLVYQVPVSSIDIPNYSINLDGGNVSTMKSLWNFEPAEKEKEIQSTVYLDYLSQPKNMINVLVLRYTDQSVQVYRFSDGQVAEDTVWPDSNFTVYGNHNSGYSFTKQEYWTVAESAFSQNTFQQEPHQFFVLLNQFEGLLIFKRIGPRANEQFVDWKSPFTGFIFYNHVFLFTAHSVVVFEDNFELAKNGYEYHFLMKEIAFKDFFHCLQKIDWLESDENETEEPEHDPNSILVNLILLFLLTIAIISFYIRSKLVTTKRIQHKKFLANKY